jgi:probable phosphoglycerate mutase
MLDTRRATAMQSLILVRHGATEPNLAGLRCGGDLDEPLTELGRQQASDAAQRILELELPVGIIVASHLERTQETARIMSRMLGGVDVVIDPAFTERRLGTWNLRSVRETEAALLSGVTPPGGESDTNFVERIAQAVDRQLLPRLAQRPLLVGSKGVARALRELLGMPRGQSLANGELLQLDLAPLRVQASVPSCHA